MADGLTDAQQEQFNSLCNANETAILFAILQWSMLVQNQIASGGGGGSGITQLTGDVTAGPGSGSVAAVVAAIQGVYISGVPTAGQQLVAASGVAAAWTTVASLTVPGANTTIPVSNGAGGFTATGVTINGSNDVGGVAGFSNSGTISLANGSIFSGGGAVYFASDILLCNGSVFGTINARLKTTLDTLNVRNGADAGPGSLSCGATDSATNTIVTALTIAHATINFATITSGFGVAHDFVLPSDNNTSRVAGRISTQWGSNPDGNEQSLIQIQPMGSGALTSGVVIGSTSLFFNGELITPIGIDTGWTANADAGDKTAVIPSSATIAGFVTALDLVASGLGAAFAATAEKCKALEAALASKLLPNA